jgi:hypothetical protein
MYAAGGFAGEDWIASSIYGGVEYDDGEGRAQEGDEVIVKPPGLVMPELGGGYRSTHWPGRNWAGG